MRIVKINTKVLDRFVNVDPEVMIKNNRPYVLIIRLKYKGLRYDFAVPLRTNLVPTISEEFYFELPPSYRTRPGHIRAIQFNKMFPVHRRFTMPYYFGKNKDMKETAQIIKAADKEVIEKGQNYLKNYEEGNIPIFSTDIDLLLETLDKILEESYN